MRVPVAFEEELRVGAEAVASAIWGARPWVESAVAEAGVLEEEVARFDPHPVIGSLPAPSTDSSGGLSWYFLLSRKFFAKESRGLTSRLSFRDRLYPVATSSSA
jgi:hypothetical protein